MKVFAVQYLEDGYFCEMCTQSTKIGVRGRGRRIKYHTRAIFTQLVNLCLDIQQHHCPPWQYQNLNFLIQICLKKLH